MSLIKKHHKVDREHITDFTVTEMDVESAEKDDDGNYIEVPLVLYGRIATADDNVKMRNAMTARFGKKTRVKAEGEKMMDAVRDLFPVHVIVDWNVHENGKKVPYDMEQCRQQITKQMSVYTLQEMLQHFGDPDNFRYSLTAEDGAELGK